jgi:hypothetical protein
LAILKNGSRGFVVGAVATIPMTVEFVLARRARLLDEIPPHKAIRSVVPGLKEPGRSVTSGFAHLLVGGGAGAVYGAVMPQRLRGWATGLAFGIVVWAIGYEAVMPAATDIRPAHRDHPSRAATIFVAHLIYGAALGAILSRLSD